MQKSQTLDTTLQFSIWMQEQKPHFTQLVFINKYLEGKTKNSLQDNQPINPTFVHTKILSKKRDRCLSSDRHLI